MVVLYADFEATLNSFHKMTKDIPKQIAMLNKELSLCDLEIQDLLHMAEFSDLSASEGYKFYKDLKITQTKRREVKNELYNLTAVASKLDGSSTLNQKLQSISDTLQVRKEKDMARYTAKVRKDLQWRFDAHDNNRACERGDGE